MSLDTAQLKGNRKRDATECCHRSFLSASQKKKKLLPPTQHVFEGERVGVCVNTIVDTEGETH